MSSGIQSLRPTVAMILAVFLGLPGIAPAQASPASGAPAAGAEVIRLRGTVESMQDGVMTLKERSGKTLHIEFRDNTGVQEIFPIDFATIKPGAVVGTTGLPQADGALRAIEVRLFPAESGGPPEGQRSSDLQPGSILANGHVLGVVATAHQRQIQLNVQNEKKSILVPDDAPVTSYRAGNIGMLKPGAKVYLHVTQAGPDQYRAASATVGANGMTPPQ
ncbi:MAG: hypothetical protein QM718_15425 [Steroidobacteraceae bacterium]